MCRKPASVSAAVAMYAPVQPKSHDTAADATHAALIASRALRRRLPGELVVHTASFLSGSSGWHIDDAAARGLLELVHLIHATQPLTTATLCTSQAMDRAAANGHLTTLQWLHLNRSEGCSQAAFYNAAKHNRLRELQWLFTHKSSAHERQGQVNGVLYHAIENGHVRIVAWLGASEAPVVPLYNAFDHACRCGHLRIAQLLDQCGQKHPKLRQSSTNAMDSAADQGHLDVVQWLHEHRREGCTTNAMDSAAARGHLHVLQWLHHHRSEGCTRRAFLNAASAGHTAVVRWLLEAEVVTPDVTLLEQAMEFAAYYDRREMWGLLAEQHRRFVGDENTALEDHSRYTSTRSTLTV